MRHVSVRSDCGEVLTKLELLIRDARINFVIKEEHSIRDVLRHLITESDWDEVNDQLQSIRKYYVD
jgi:peroxiredoxin